MYKKADGWVKHLDFIVLDMFSLILAYVLGYALCGFGWNPFESMLYRRGILYLILANGIVLFLFETLKNVLKFDALYDLKKTLKHAVLVTGLAVLYLFLLKEGKYYSRSMLMYTMLIYTVLTFSLREVRKRILYKKMENGDKSALLIVTNDDMAESVLHNIEEQNYAQYKIVGIALIDSSRVGETVCDVPIVADSESLSSYVCNEWIDEILIVTSGDKPYSKELVNSLVETGVTLHFNLIKVPNISGKKQFVEKVGAYTVLTTSMNYASARELFLKRLMDIAVGLVGCIATGIAFLFVAPAIYISSPGPIFFSQERVGQNGKKFKIYKFRSMYMDAEKRRDQLMKDNKLGDGKMFKLDFDPRVIGNKILPDGTHKTGVGEFIRKTSLDEFPQFFNVLKGDMSVVGTRPPLVGEVRLYEPRHHARLAIKPGITGMWQVSGRSDITDFEQVVRLDKQYINEWSLGLDLKILFKTFLVVLRKDGSV